MRIVVLGTGTVGQTLAGAFDALGHEVTVGTRDVDAARSRRAASAEDAPGFGDWCDDHPSVRVATLDLAAVGADLVVNATSGTSSLSALEQVGEAALAGRVVLDVANPLDFSTGFPPTLSVCNDDSLAEQIQRRFPDARVVKSLNTVTAALMVAPRLLGDGLHTIFVSGDDSAAKALVTDVLTSLGWTDILDLGDLSTARGTEMYLALWTRLFGATGSPILNVRLVR